MQPAPFSYSRLQPSKVQALDEELIVIKGCCACAKVQYQVDGDLKDYCHCHCSICRKLHGAAFVTWGGVARGELSFVSGEDGLRAYAFSEKADSYFCNTCGSRVLVDYKPEIDMLYIALGTVDGDLECPDGFHQFVGSKVPWFEITDGLPEHDGWPGEQGQSS
jgi:hypothetical protein